MESGDKSPHSKASPNMQEEKWTKSTHASAGILACLGCKRNALKGNDFGALG